jgi:membrane protease subunit HflK
MKRKRKTSDVVFQGLEAGLRLFRWVVVILLVLFIFSGITKIEPDSVGLLLRFGELQGASPGEQVRQPGLLLALPYPIDEVRSVPGKDKEEQIIIDEVWKSFDDPISDDKINPVTEGYCLTGDSSVLQAKLAVKYKITDPVAAELWIAKEDREDLLRDVVLAALVQTVAGWTFDDAFNLSQRAADSNGVDAAAADVLAEDVLAEEMLAEDMGEVEDAPAEDGGGKESVGEARLPRIVWRRAQERLDALASRGPSRGCGITISALEFQEKHPPRHVKTEFEAVQNAKIAKQTLLQRAYGLQNREIPKARADRNQMVQDAKAYKDSLIARANADVSEFEQLYKEYQRNPNLIWQRIYQESLEQIFGNVGKRMFVSPGSRVIIGENGDQQP